MKFTCEKTQLANALSIASRTVCQKSSIAVLEGILLQAGDGLRLTGYNLETGITVRMDAEIERPGDCVMPARLFFDIVRKLDSDELTLEVDDSYRVTIRGGNSHFSILASAAEDYPSLPSVDAENSIAIPENALRELISGTIFAVSDKQTRPIYTGCLFEVSPEGVNVIAIDSFRLAKRSWHPEAPFDKTMNFVVPAAALKELEKLLGDSEDEVRFSLGAKHILFTVGGATLVCRLLEGDFLDWRRIVPLNHPIVMVADVATLMASIERVGLIVSEKYKSPVRCVFRENEAELRTLTTIGTARDVCPLAGDGKGIEIGFNNRYLLDALKSVPTEEVRVEINNGLSPIVLRPCDDKADFVHMIMSVRLKPGE